MSNRVTAGEVSRHFSDFLTRVHDHRETFVIVRGGEELGRLVPPALPPGMTARGLLDLLQAEWPDAEYARDLERVQEEQSQLPS